MEAMARAPVAVASSSERAPVAVASSSVRAPVAVATSPSRAPFAVTSSSARALGTDASSSERAPVASSSASSPATGTSSSARAPVAFASSSPAAAGTKPAQTGPLAPLGAGQLPNTPINPIPDLSRIQLNNATHSVPLQLKKNNGEISHRAPTNVQYQQNAQSSPHVPFPQHIRYPIAQNPQNIQYHQNAQNPQKMAFAQFIQNSPNLQNPSRQNPVNRSRTQNPPRKKPVSAANSKEPASNRVIVSGYPAYTKPHDILEVFSKFGNVRIDRCNSWTSTLTYPTEEQACNAIAAEAQLHIYGHFLSVKPYSGNMKDEAQQTQQSPKREFPKTQQKSIIIDPKELNLSGDFNKQLDLILATIRLNQDDISRISSLYRDLEAMFQSLWPGCKAIPFGSITTGLGIKTSDADCFISLPIQFRQPQVNYVNQARRLLTQQPHIYTEILAIPRANTPIVKFYHIPTNINCDLTFKTPLGAQNSRLITFLLQSDPRITPMAVIIKYWAKVHDLSGTGKLTNYALTLLIIFYLQQPPLSILPSVEWLQRDRANDVFVDYWNTGFMSNAKFLPRISNTSKISELLGGFFEFYALFNFEEMVVCPFLGTPIKKEMFKESLKNLPCQFDLYRNNVLNGIVMPIRYQTSFCVQDPFEQCHNVASIITGKLALDIKSYFRFVANAYEEEKANHCEGFLKTMLLEKPKLIRGKTHLEYRVALFPRLINTIIDFEWKPVVREIVRTIFEVMMKIKLGKVEEKVNPDTKKDKEKYTGNVTKPIWRRKKYSMVMKFPQDMYIDEKQALITEEIITKEAELVNLQVHVIMTFCHDPKSAVVAIRMIGGDIDAFRDFGKFYISVMQNWFTQLLKPHSMPDCKDAATKIAKAAIEENNLKGTDSDDEDEEIEKHPSPSPTEDDDVAEDRTTNSSDDAITKNDASQDGDVNGTDS